MTTSISTVTAIEGIGEGLENLARAVISLGPGEEYANKDLGAIEEFRRTVESGFVALSTSINGLAEAIREHSS